MADYGPFKAESGWRWDIEFGGHFSIKGLRIWETLRQIELVLFEFGQAGA